MAADGSREWRFRFTPTRPGVWRWRWLRVTASGEEAGELECFRVLPNLDTERHGFLRIPDGAKHLEFEDGTPFFAVGENLSWADRRGTGAYEDWIAKLDASGANYIRLWMPEWDMGLLYEPATLEDWSARMDRAWRLDRVMELAEQHDVRVMLSLQSHFPFELDSIFGSGWGTNPFNAANGGPLAAPDEVYTDPFAREIFRRYLRYVVARWGYSPNLLAWELWNESDLAEQPSTIDPVVDWHREMARLLHELDPNDHLVTTSTTDEAMTIAASLGNLPIPEYPLRYEPVWQLPEIDFVQLHSYQIHSLGVVLPVADTIFELVDRMAQYGKPVLLAEAGVDVQGLEENREGDPEGEGFHDLLWAGAFSGAFGSGMCWWWDLVVDPEDWYFHFTPLARLTEGVPFAREPFERHRGLPVDAPDHEVVAHVLSGRATLLAWVRNEGAVFAPPLAVDGRWVGEWIDPWSGAILGVVDVRAEEPHRTPELAVPSFSRDVALRLDHAPVQKK
ncbi:MAG: cellulase family glycosylhydrolase [Deltaproteobacteria bacterium]|nr:cellulase family glycosylhydrolase [Deltaproteobacteria bacterium]